MKNIPQKVVGLPVWKGSITVEPLSGGLSNEGYIVADQTGKYVVRFCKDLPVHHVVRDHEAMVSRAAFEAGYAPELIYYGNQAMVFRFIEARTLEDKDIWPNLERLVAVIGGFHRDTALHVRGPARIFWVFHVIRDYVRTLSDDDGRHDAMLAQFLTINSQLEAVQTPLPVVYTHNDLLAANFLDDGEKIWLIDFEYAGFATAMFDLANLAANAKLEPDQDVRLLELYFGARPDAQLIRSHAAMKCASAMREALWAMVSQIHLDTPGVDYPAYVEETRQLLDAELAGYQDRYGRFST